MKRKTLLLFMLIALFAPLAMNGQSTYSWGSSSDYSNNSNYANPFGRYYGYEYRVFLYAPNTMPFSGNITKIEFLPAESMNTTGGQMTVWMKTVTDITELSSSTTFATYKSGATQVYNTSSSPSYTADSYVSIPLSTPIAYNYNNNEYLMILVRSVANNSTDDGNTSFYYKNPGSASNNTWYAKNDSNDPGESSNSWDSNGTGEYLPVIRFTYTGATPSIALSPSSATITAGNTQTLTATVNNVSGTSTITYSSSNTSVATVSGSGTTATVTGVSAGTATITASITVSGTTYSDQSIITVEAASYCTPAFSKTTDYITDFSLGSISNTNSGFSTGGYGNFTNLSTNLDQGASVTASLTSSSGSGTHAAAVWIDFNDNNTFETSERVGTKDGIGESATVNIDLTIPNDAAAGSHRMRVVYQYNVDATNIDPCASASYGEAEDYTVIITALSNCEGFETDLGNWVVTYDNSNYQWARKAGTGNGNYTSAGEGSYNVGAFYGSNSSYYTYLTLNTDLSSYTNTNKTISFKYINPSWQGDIDYIYLQYSTDGTNWTDLQSYTSGTSTWTQVTDLSIPDAAKYIRFAALNKYGYGVGLDEICLDYTENEGYTVTASANPTEGGTVSFLAGTDAGTTTNTHLPTDSYFEYGLTEEIYTPEEIGGGTINSIAFYCEDASNVSFTRTYDIYMVHTDKTVFENGNDWIPVTTSDKVFSGSVTYNPGEWTTITLNSSFEYDGVHNLALVMDDNTNDYTSGSYLKCRVFTPSTDGFCSMNVHSVGTNFDPTDSSLFNQSDYTAGTNSNFDDGMMKVKNLIRVDGSSRTFPSGTSCTLVATANENYNFVNWTDNGSTAGSNTTYTISNLEGDHDVVANFALDGFTVHAIASPVESGISVSLNGGTAGTDITEMFASNANVTITATCSNSDYYGFAYWAITYFNSDGDPITFSSTDNPYNLSDIDENYTFTAYFAPKNINSVARWNAFCNAVNGVYSEWYNDQVGGYNYSQKTVYLTANVGPVTTMAGVVSGEQTTPDGDQTFRGTFDGGGHTLTINLNSDGADDQNFYYCAPFRKVYGATFKDLKVSGSITTVKQGAGGIAGWVYGANFTNCVSDVTITNNYTGGDATSGGLVSNVRNTTYFTGCAFTGRFVSTQNTPKWGGFVGWRNATTTITDCVYAPSQAPSGISTSGCSTFARNGATITNSYYTQALGTAQGKQYYTIAPGSSNVSVDMRGTETVHNVSGIKSYADSQGLRYYKEEDDYYYIIAGNGDQVNLMLNYNYGVDNSHYVTYNTSNSNNTLDPNAGTVGSNSLETTLSMGASTDTFIYASLMVSSFEITATANPTEGGTVTGAGTYDNDATCTLTATPNTGYIFVNWTEGGIEVSTNANYEFTVTADRDLVANFALDTYTITATSYPEEAGAITGAATYNYGETCTLTVTTNTPAALNTSFNFTGWYENDELVNSNTTYSFTVTAARTLEARFTATITKQILGYNENDNPNKPNGRWYLIASPLSTNIAPTAVTNMVAETAKDYDLFYFMQNAPVDPETGLGLEWINYKDATDGGFDLENTKGYLYANKETVNLSFTGVPEYGSYNEFDGTRQVVVPLSYVSGFSKSGWNLLGNPFNSAAWLDCHFYVMNAEGTEIIYWRDANVNGIQPLEGFFVYTDDPASFNSVTISTQPSAKSATLALNVTQGRGLVDCTAIGFDNKGSLPKFQLNPNHTKIYIPQSDKDYAVVSAESDMGEMPVNFKAEKNGTYTISANADEVNFNYLHLIDNLTGADVDLLDNPSYSFDARTTDYDSRFRLVFATANSDDDNFGFYNGSAWVINNEGEAILQVVDVMGRIIKSETINGCANVSINAAPGVYMLRLINGNNVKVQKVVVR